jgi:GTPase SAR1 family protein
LPPNIPGRAYIQVGNENVELMQVARAGGPYTGPAMDTSPPVLWPKRPVKAQAASSRSNAEAAALSDVIVQMCRELADSHEEIKPQKKPWPDPLPFRMPLDGELPPDARYMDTLEKAHVLSPAVLEWMEDRGAWRGINWMEEAMRTNIGLVDRPIRAEQLVLPLDLTKGHAVLFGASGWGKTTFIRTVITGLAATHSPNELNIYMMDFGGRGLDVLTDMPHVVASVLPSEEEKVLRMLRRASNILEERRSILSAARADNLLVYNQTNPDKALPAILIVIDNFAEFRENFENYIDGLIGLVRDGRAYGLYFVITALLTNTLPGKLYNLFTERFTLRLADAGEYSNVVGRGVPDMGEIAGRGFVSIDREPLEFHTAIPVTATPDEEQAGLDDTKKLAQLALKMKMAWKRGRVAPPIDILRPVISLKGVLPEQTPAKVQVILGLEDQNLEPAQIDLAARGPHMVIIGPPLSGKTTALRSWVMSMAQMYSPERVVMVLVDFQQRMFKYGGKRTLGDLPQVYAAISEAKDLERVITDIKQEYESQRTAEMPTRPEIFFIADNYDDFAGVVGASTMTKSTVYKDLAELGRKFGPEGFHLVVAGSMNLMRGPDEFIKQALAPRFGLGLDANDAPTALGGRAKAGGAEFPPGRGYIVKSGRMQLIQVATPQAEGTLEESLDAWIEEIQQEYPDRAKLIRDFLPPKPEEPAAPVTPATPAATPAVPATPPMSTGTAAAAQTPTAPLNIPTPAPRPAGPSAAEILEALRNKQPLPGASSTPINPQPVKPKATAAPATPAADASTPPAIADAATKPAEEPSNGTSKEPAN